MTTTAAIALAAAVTAAGLAPRAQPVAPQHPGPQPPIPTFRVGSDLVVVDLVATDGNQRFVSDLRPEEIRIEEDGRERPLQFLQLVRVGQPAGSSAAGIGVPATPGTAPAQHALPTAASEPRSLAIVIDLLGTPQDAMPRVRGAIRKMVLEQVPDGTPLMLATAWHGVTVHHPFATDRARFLAALDELASPAGTGSSLQRFAALIDHTPGMQAQEAINIGRSVVIESHRELAEAAQGLSALARLIGPLPGRKHVVVYTMGHAIRPVQGVIALIDNRLRAGRLATSELANLEVHDGTGELRRLVDEANRSQVSFYAVDPAGLQSGGFDATYEGSVRAATMGAPGVVGQRPIREPQEYLRTIARDTGGRAFLNTNDLTAGVRRAWSDSGEYYLVGFTPAESLRKPTGYRRIELKVARRGLDLRYRRGYWRDTEQGRSDRDLVLASRFPDLFMNGDLAVEANVAAGTLTVTSLLRPTALRFTEREGRQHGAFRIEALLRDGAGKLVGGKGLFAMDVTMKLPVDEMGVLQTSERVEIPASVPAPPSGSYQLVVVLRHSGTLVTTALASLVVP